MTIRTVVVGYGRAGQHFHCQLIKLAPGLTLHGVVSGDPAKHDAIRAQQGAKPYSSIDEALGDADVQLVVLATPHHTHAPLAIQAMNAGKHVVTDKVMCLSLAECDAMIEASRRNHVMLSVFQNRRWDGDFLTARSLIESGALGNVRWIELSWQMLGISRNWRSTLATGGGKYYDLGSHMIDQLLQLIPDRVESVYCRMRHEFEGTDVPSDTLLVVNFESGRTGVIDCSATAHLTKPRFYLRGTKATFEKRGLDPQEKALLAGDIDSAVNDPANDGVLSDGKTQTRIPTLPGRWRSYYENIADVLLKGAAPAVSLDSLRRQILILEAGMRSARENAVLTLNA